MRPVWNVYGDFHEWIYDGLLDDFTTRRVFETGQLLSRDDLSDYVRKLAGDEKRKQLTLMSRMCLVRLLRRSLSGLLNASGLRTYPE